IPQEFLLRRIADVALEEQIGEEAHQLLVGLLAVLASQQRRIAAPAKARILRRGQSESEVLAEQQRLAVEPACAAVPALDRWRIEHVLSQLLEDNRQGRRAGSAFESAHDSQGEIDRRL